MFVCSSQAIKNLLRNADPVFQAEKKEADEVARKQREAEAEAARRQQQREAEEAARVEKEAGDRARKQEEVEDAAHRAKEAEEALMLAATSNFTGLTPVQVGDLLVSFGEQYVGYRENVIKMDLTGALVAQSLDDNDLSDILKDVGVTGKLQQKVIEMKFKTFYQPLLTSTLGTTPAVTSTTIHSSSSIAASTVSVSSVSNLSSSSLMTIPWTDLYVEPLPSSRLGKGSFGIVFGGKWKPVQLRNVGRDVAVKVMTRFLVQDTDYLQAVQCAQEEAVLIHNLCLQHGPAISDFVMHVYGFAEGPIPPNLITAFNLPPGDQGFGIVMGLASGGTLSHLLYGGPPLRLLSMFDKLSICAQLARGVTELHAVGLVHGDMKPANVLFGDSSVTSLKIADFGTARIRGQLDSTLGQSTLQRTGHMQGTPIYSAPEMMEEEDEDEDDEGGGKTSGVARASRSTDVYALAIIMHEILTRKKPFDDIKTFKKLSKKVLKGDRPPIEKLPADTPSAIKEMIQRCWDSDRTQRLSAYRCALILAQALPVFEQQQGVVRPTSANVEPLSKTLTRRLDDAKLAAFFDKLERMENSMENNQKALIGIVGAGFEGVHAHLDELSEQLSVSLNGMGNLLADLSQRAAAGDAKTEAGLSALLDVLQSHQSDLVKGQAHDQAHLERLVRAAMTGMEETLSTQLQQCLTAIMDGNNDAATRDASANEKIEALVGVVTDLKEEVNSVHNLTLRQHELLQVIEKRSNLMPHSFIILPKLQPILDKDASAISKMKNCLLRQKDRLTGLVWEQSTLFFVCPVTRKLAVCGPEGKGYPINLPKAWVRALAPALQWGLFFLKVALATQGLGGVVPDIPTEWLKQLNALPGPNQLVKLESVINQIATDGVVTDTLAIMPDGGDIIASLDQATSMFADWETIDEDRAKSAFAQVFKFLAEAEGYPNGVSDRDWKPQYTGLHLTSPPVGGRSSSLWVSRPEGVALFEKKGWDALKSSTS